VDGAGSFVETVAVEMDLVKSVILSSMDHFLQHYKYKGNNLTNCKNLSRRNGFPQKKTQLNRENYTHTRFRVNIRRP
jgi:hypothetical protein